MIERAHRVPSTINYEGAMGRQFRGIQEKEILKDSRDQRKQKMTHKGLGIRMALDY